MNAKNERGRSARGLIRKSRWAKSSYPNSRAILTEAERGWCLTRHGREEKWSGGKNGGMTRKPEETQPREDDLGKQSQMGVGPLF